MTGEAWSTGIDPLALCTGFSVLAGVLAVVDPYFFGLTLALASLGASVWVARVLGGPRRRCATSRAARALPPAAAVVLGWVPVLTMPTLLGRGAGLVLAGTGVILWWDGRRRAGEAS